MVNGPAPKLAGSVVDREAGGTCRFASRQVAWQRLAVVATLDLAELADVGIGVEDVPAAAVARAAVIVGLPPL
jgi:hypothetical protein